MKLYNLLRKLVKEKKLVNFGLIIFLSKENLVESLYKLGIV